MNKTGRSRSKVQRSEKQQTQTNTAHSLHHRRCCQRPPLRRASNPRLSPATLAVLLPTPDIVSMFLLSLLSLFATPAFGQDIVYNQAHNVTNIFGTWSSGSQNVVTGPVSPSDVAPITILTRFPSGLCTTRQCIVCLPTNNRLVLFIVSRCVACCAHAEPAHTAPRMASTRSPGTG